MRRVFLGILGIGAALVLMLAGAALLPLVRPAPPVRAWVLWLGASPVGGGALTEWINAVAAFERRSECDASPKDFPEARRGIRWVFGCFPSETYPRGASGTRLG
ncbi:MAG: hypothetical protein ACREN5_14100 [Gemmatimonadales bacterium]